jgi:hypothetical protein
MTDVPLASPAMPALLNWDDERAIIAILLRYATAIDQRNWPLLASCFTDHVEADYAHIGRWAGRDSFVEHMAKGHAKLGPTLHRITNCVVVSQLDGAAATSYVDALLMRQESGKTFRQAHGWYEDQLVRNEQGWKIRRRRFIPVLIQDFGQ